MPATSQAIVRSGTGDGSALYTVPDGRTLVILGAWITVFAAAGMMTGQLTVTSEDGGGDFAIVAAIAPDNAVGSNSVSCTIRCPAGSRVIFEADGAYVTRYGIHGYLE